MTRTPERLGQGSFDLLVIGGGILGAGIARDAALRGLSVALVEQGDFASGTSSKTTKLIHGGIRYLEQFDFQLVHEACHERRILIQMVPQWVTPLPFVIPVYRRGPRPAWKVRAGVTLYDWLAGRARLAPNRFYGAGEARQLEPVLDQAPITAAAEYHDAQMDDIRLCLENIAAAAAAGAVVINYAKVVRFQWQRPAGTSFGRPTGVPCGRDHLTGAEVQSLCGPGSWLVHARSIVNATGPWADAIRRLADPQARRLVRRSKGIHVVYPRIPITRALVLSAYRDGRVFFLIPWRGWTLIGTTETDFDAAPDQARATAEEVEYLLSETNRLLPGLGLSRDRIITTFAGVRPLVATAGRQTVPCHVSRSHLIREDAGGLISVLGGKYTTYRLIAEEVVDRVVRRLSVAGAVPRTFGSCRTAEEPLTASVGRAQILAAMATSNPALAQPFCRAHQRSRAEVRYAVEDEWATSLTDVLCRRLELVWAPCQGLDCAQAAAETMADVLGWDEAGIRRQVESYREAVLADHRF